MFSQSVLLYQHFVQLSTSFAGDKLLELRVSRSDFDKQRLLSIVFVSRSERSATAHACMTTHSDHPRYSTSLSIHPTADGTFRYSFVSMLGFDTLVQKKLHMSTVHKRGSQYCTVTP